MLIGFAGIEGVAAKTCRLVVCDVAECALVVTDVLAVRAVLCELYVQMRVILLDVVLNLLHPDMTMPAASVVCTVLMKVQLVVTCTKSTACALTC